jgi:hypothetical protein
MKSPVVLVTAALTAAILLAASLLIATGTRGEGVLRPLTEHPAGRSADVADCEVMPAFSVIARSASDEAIRLSFCEP